MNQRFLMWAFASIVFVVTLGISSWQEGLWASPNEPTAAHHTHLAALASDDVAPMPTRPFSPETPAVAPPPPPPVVAAVTPQPPPPPPAETPPPADTPPMPSAVPDMDEEEFRAHEDRAAQHSARAH